MDETRLSSETSWTSRTGDAFQLSSMVVCLWQYADKEEVVLWMNTVGPYHNRQETYKYFSLPFCAGSKKTISHYHETLGEALQGVELEFSGLDIKFKGYHHKCLKDHNFRTLAACFLCVICRYCRWGYADDILWNWVGQTQTGRFCLRHQESLLVPNVHRWSTHLG